MAKKIALWASGIVLIVAGLAWQLIRNSDYFHEATGSNDALGLLGVILGGVLLAAGAGIIVKAVMPNKQNNHTANEGDS